jgi:hypothetical protein
MTPRRTNGPAAPPAPRQTLANVTTAGRKLPSRLIMHAIPKWGKTSFAAQAPKPIFLMTRGEDGLVSLMDAGLAPPTAHFPEPFTRWADLLAAINELAQGGHEYRTVVLDTLNGAERLAHEATCAQDCQGDWEKFDAYGRGIKLSLVRIIELTSALDRCRERGLAVMLLGHSQVKTFRNPAGPDYDRWEPVLAKESWAHLDRWADLVLFGCFEVLTEQKARGAKAKATGGQTRLLMTERRAEYDAGNRLGLPEEIDCGTSAAQAWANFQIALKSKKE